jgi:hypothetical protein
MDIDTYTFVFNKQQKKLRQLLNTKDQHQAAIQAFLAQHGPLHSAKIAREVTWSFPDEIFKDASEEIIRRIPQKAEHSIAWTIWHAARCEDITMNLLVAGEPQVLMAGDWMKKMKTPFAHSGNAMNEAEVKEFSDGVDLEALRAYRLAVGMRTREVVSLLEPGDFKKKVDPARIETVWAQGAVVEAASGVVDYWASREIAGLLLMPPTRHTLTHLNEALRLKKKRK